MDSSARPGPAPLELAAHRGVRIVYVAGTGFGGTLFAVDGATGDLLWERPVSSGDHSSPVVTEDSVYLSFRQGIAVSLRLSDRRAQQWQRVPNGSGGGGRTPVLHDGRLYVETSTTAPSSTRHREEARPLAPRGVAPGSTPGRGYFVEQDEPSLATLRARSCGGRGRSRRSTRRRSSQGVTSTSAASRLCTPTGSPTEPMSGVGRRAAAQRHERGPVEPVLRRHHHR